MGYFGVKTADGSLLSIPEHIGENIEDYAGKGIKGELYVDYGEFIGGALIKVDSICFKYKEGRGGR